MRKHSPLICFFFLAGCASIDFTPNKVWRVTGGYIPNRSVHARGDEFLFSLVPPAGKWGYARGKPWFQPDNGLISFTSPGYPDLDFEWLWRSDFAVKSDLEQTPYIAPWINGTDPKMERVPYTPTERQIKSGDWNQPGYSQTQWHQFRYFGKKPYYCLTTLSKSREGLIAFEGQRSNPFNAYWYTISCPFRLTDGRNARLNVHSRFSITDEKLQANPHRIEENLVYIDKILEPTWNSLIVMPQAYQFEPSSSAFVPQP